MDIFSYVLTFVTMVGRLTLELFMGTGRFTLFVCQTFSYGLRPPYYKRLLISHLFHIGYLSLPVVGLTALFTGMVLALQSYTGFSRFHAESSIATVVVLSMTRELGPVLGGLMVTGRVGAAMAAEIATMRVTEQIDALYTLSANPLRYLVWPRFLATLIALPFLVLISDIIGIMGGYLVGVYKLNFSSYHYLKQTVDYLAFSDVFSGLVKAFVFGGLIALCSCYQGYMCAKGARGVGHATTKAVVSSSIAILIFNYVLTFFFFD